LDNMSKKKTEKSFHPKISFLILMGLIVFFFLGYLFMKWR